jgi:hypothetical protein
MIRILLAVALVLVMAIPAMSAVKPTPMNIVVYYDVPVYQYYCSVNFTHIGGNTYYCGELECVFVLIGCAKYEWVAKPLVYEIVGRYDVEITSAEVGKTYHVNGTIFSELPKNIKYQLIIKNGITTVYKTAKIPVTPLDGGQEIQFDDFTFENPGLYTFTLQVIKPDGTIVKVAKKVFVPAPGIALEEGPALEEEPVLEESIGE